MSQFVFPVLFVLLLSWPMLLHAGSNISPKIMLAMEYKQGVELSQYSVTEKFDGVRAIWHDGKLLTRSGRLINAPNWFVSGLPDVDVEGELWIGYGRFDDVSGLVRRGDSLHPLWRDVQFMIFDLPNMDMPYEDRMAFLASAIHSEHAPRIKVVEQRRFTTQDQLDCFLYSIVKAGGEGVMLNRVQADYIPQRSDAILKYKPKWDAEALVIDHILGKGKYENLMGSILVRMSDGREFRIGTGFSDEERKHPPAINSWITFEYSGLTSTGKPRFARYLRVYESL